MPANTPIPSPVALFPTVAAWLDDMNTRFAANRYGQIDDADFRAVFTGMAQVFADWRHLSVKRVKGATYPVPYTDTLGLVAPEYRIVGMQAVALNGTDSTTGGAGVVAPPIYYTLLRFSGGDVDALLDVEPNTTLTVKARWVRTSGGEEEKKASFPPLFLEDHTYDAGDVVQYTFLSGETRLFEFRTDSVGFQLPAPTGLDDDPLYKPFAPLTTAAGYDDTAVLARVTATESVANLTKQRLDTLVVNAPQALDTLKEISDQLAADEAGAAAILATQQQHTQQIAQHGGWIGTLSNLLTNAKTNVVGAVNELFTALTTKASLVGGKVPVAELPVPTATTAGITRAGRGLYGFTALNATAVDFVSEIVSTYDGVNGLGGTVGFAYALNGYTELFMDNTLAAAVGRLISVRNTGTTALPVLGRGSGFTDTVQPGEIVWYKALDAASNFDVVLRAYTRPGTAAPGPGALPTKLQIRSDSANRVLTLRLDEAVTLTALTAIAANNSSAAKFQVNKYQNGAFVAGAVRTTLAAAQTDLNTLAAADYATGVELLIQTVPVDAAAAAYLFIEFIYG